MKFEPRNVFITGGAGFIGANFTRHWLETSAAGQVVVFDALTYAGNIQNLAGLERHPRYVFIKGDICDEPNVQALLRRYNIDTLIHFAAESHVDRSILGPDEFIRTNVTGTHSLLKATRAFWLDSTKPMRTHRFHHVSTDEVYGSLGSEDPPFHELSPYAPNSPYSASKAASDHLVRAYHETYGLSTTITNCSNNYGQYQFPEKLIPLTIINILLGKPIPVYGDGLQVRDWLNVADHCAAISLALSNGIAGEVYNIGGDGETTNLDIVKMLCGMVDEELAALPAYRQRYPNSPLFQGMRAVDLISHVRDRQGHDRRYAVNYSKAAARLGYAPSCALAHGLKETAVWYLREAKWWQQLNREPEPTTNNQDR
jgi:dTDP-glucose 4,6-dehydratase